MLDILQALKYVEKLKSNSAYKPFFLLNKFYFFIANFSNNLAIQNGYHYV